MDPVAGDASRPDVDLVDVVALTRALVDIDSTTGREAAAGRLAEPAARRARLPRRRASRSAATGSTCSRRLGDDAAGRASPRTTTACRRSSRAASSAACSSAAACATPRASWPRRWPPPSGCGSAARRASACCSSSARSGAATAPAWPTSARPPASAILINGEPTDNRLGIATRGILRVRLVASGRAAHSSFPELGESAIDKLLDALMVVRGVELPDDVELGRTHYTVGLIDGGVAPNVVSPHADGRADVPHRGRRRRRCARRSTSSKGWWPSSTCSTFPPCGCTACPGFETAVFPVHDRRAAADATGACRSSSVPAPSTWRTPTTSTCRSTSCATPSTSTKRWPRGCCRRRASWCRRSAAARRYTRRRKRRTPTRSSHDSKMCSSLVAVALTVACTRATPEQQIVNDAAAALGGAERVSAVKTLVLEGTGTQYNLGQDLVPGASGQTFTVSAFKRTVDVAGGRARTELTRKPELHLLPGPGGAEAGRRHRRRRGLQRGRPTAPPRARPSPWPPIAARSCCTIR